MSVFRTIGDLLHAIGVPGNSTIEVRGEINDCLSLLLKPGQTLNGGPDACIRFAPGQDGVIVAADCVVQGLELRTDPGRCALRNEDGRAGFGRLVLDRLRTVGSVRLIAVEGGSGGHVEARDVHVMEADTRAVEQRPTAFGVSVVPGAFTLWNARTAPDDRIGAELRGLAAGGAAMPVRGSGILVGGMLGGGGLSVGVLETGDIHSDGGIAPGTPDRIAGGVFILQGTDVDEVRNSGAVTTYGPNDMVLDNWGRVKSWRALGDITSHGPSGIGFVNLGELGDLVIDGVLETHGLGACGFNSGEVKQPTPGAVQTTDEPVAGAVRQAIFERIVTRGDGAIGLQISVPIGRLLVRRGVETHGGVGASLARGVVTRLAAVALSVKPGGSAREIAIEGGLTTRGRGIDAIELHGVIDSFHVAGGAGPTGEGFAVS